jgi:HEAT repeat protein
VRHHALRLVRKTLAREDTWRAARWFLEDEDPAARRMAIRIVCHGEDEEALPAVVALLLDPVAWVREEALAGLRRRREEAIPLVERARARARPDEARRLGAALAGLRGEGG